MVIGYHAAFYRYRVAECYARCHMPSAESGQWPTIVLAWSQRVAAFWLLAWPSFLISFALLSVLSMGWTVVGLRTHAELLAWTSAISFLFCQGILIRRMVRKKYRSFRLEIIRENTSGTASLTTAEVARVWLKIIWPQVVFLVAVWLMQFLLADRLNEDTTRAISTLSLWGRILVVGPFGIYCAVPADYPGFRLEAFGQRFV